MRQLKPTSNQEELLARRDQVATHYLPFARLRASQGNHFYPAIVAYYEAELADLEARLARPAKRTKKRAA